MSDYYGFLKKVDLFKNLSDSDILKINGVCREQYFHKNEIVFVEGAFAEKLFIILNGKVEVWKDYNTGRSDLLAVHGSGRMFGEMALLDNLPRSATVVAREPSRMLYIHRKNFNEILGENSSISVSIARSISGMVRRSNETFIENLRSRNEELEKANKELKLAQEELLKAERLTAIGKFSSLILHDIRNPISVLRGYAELIRESPDDQKLLIDRAGRIVDEVERLEDLANELLDFCRGDIKLDMTLVDLNAFLQGFAEEFRDRFAAQEIEIHLGIENGIKVLMDEKRMHRVFVNLAENALKAMPDGGDFYLNVRKKGRYLKIENVDTGVGMEQNEIRRMFDPFFSGFKSGGTGLGMTIVKSIIEAHKGALTVKSRPGEGAAFSILLPRVE